MGYNIIITILTSGLILLVLSYLQANAQLIPVPPPAPNTIVDNNEEQAQNDKHPPHIEVLTTELKQGKNVIKVKITDESTIELREIRYVHDGKIRSAELVKDQNNIYKGLVTAKPPSAVVVINAGDIFENKATMTKLLSVLSPSDLFSQILNFLNIN
jgi:LysM repeat protein